MRHTFWSCLMRCANMKGIQWVLMMIQSGHVSVHRRTDGRTDRRTRWYQYTPPFNFVEAGGINTICRTVTFTETPSHQATHDSTSCHTRVGDNSGQVLIHRETDHTCNQYVTTTRYTSLYPVSVLCLIWGKAWWYWVVVCMVFSLCSTCSFSKNEKIIDRQGHLNFENANLPTCLFRFQ